MTDMSRGQMLERIAELERLERAATQHAFDAEADRDRERTNVANAKAEIARLRERNSTSNADTYSWYVKECDRREELESRIARVREIADAVECTNCDHEARFHNDGQCTASTAAGTTAPCRCSWGRGNIAEAIDEALGEDSADAV